MPYQITIREVPAWPLAVAHGRCSFDDIPLTIGTLLDVVWDFAAKAGLKTDGHNVVLYSDVGPSGVTIDAGVRVVEPFDGIGVIKSISTPAGRVATTAHIGPYDELPQAHKAVDEWCRANDHPLAGPNWELYGHWTDDPAALRTDVFYLLL